MAALWTGVCLATAVLSALDDGFEVYIVTDASAGVTARSPRNGHPENGPVRCGSSDVAAGASGWQRDSGHARKPYNAVMSVAKEHAGGYGLGINYAKAMLGEHASEAQKELGNNTFSAIPEGGE